MAPPAVAGSATGQAIVVAAHPLAVEAGTEVLARGGSAMDAALAVQLMLGLVEPQSSGLGGGAFITAYDARTRQVTTYLGREQAPASASTAMFDDEDGQPLPRDQAMLSGRATGVPGTVAVFALALQDHGRLPWFELFGHTARTAEAGFTISPRMARHIHGTFPQARTKDVQAFFRTADGRVLDAGDTLRNPAYAATLRTLAERGPRAFYEGELASRIVARTLQAPLPGGMTTADLASYAAEKAEPLCRPIGGYRLCTPPPPSSGVGLLQLMALLEQTDIGARGPQDPHAWFLFAEASRIMYADRDRYVGDPRFNPVPVDGLLAPDYVRARIALIGARAAADGYPAGTPAGAPQAGRDETAEAAGTTHFVVVDRDGNAASVTSTVESYFGSGRMVDGFFLNNQLTDFAWDHAQGRPGMANAIAPGKRPRSSMTPAILLDADGRLAGAIGSPGGSAIPAYIGKALVGALYWDLALDEAIALPNLVARGRRFDGEAGGFAPHILDGLHARGVDVRPGAGEDSGLHGILLRDGRWQWGADPRREGTAAPLP
ncbi:gamma-glutamyltransferase family protein [Pseudoxanthomonas daejeonensis]|uniref:gamma-glutamyltransferase family protein n=1 Tax=Pseudoxanthomonas daejeonensis TaxID=266062 RepID=UPI001F53EF2F|nr:gamma-glutamyltransferase family protein [Pseudoxanthomonas daejeonensis]UNK56166.1 gamma-glutamyltransferase family protein [Pseudoxanthomonas daejeonensis]